MSLRGTSDKSSAQLQFGIEANRAALELIIDIATRQKLHSP